MKTIVAALAALPLAVASFAVPASAETLSKQAFSQQDWPKQDWYVLQVTTLSGGTPAFAKPDGGASPPYNWAAGAASFDPGFRPSRRQTVAMDVNAIRRDGDKADVSYFVWSDDKEDYTQISSRIDCGRSGEQVVSWRRYDENFAYVGEGDRAFRRIDATARAVAGQVCRAPKTRTVSGKSLPEVVQGG